MKRAEMLLGFVALLVVLQQVRIEWQEKRIKELERGQAQVTEFMEASASAVKAHGELLHKLTELERLNSLVEKKLQAQDADNSAAVIRLARFTADLAARYEAGYHGPSRLTAK
jgi:hypothetical protein